MAIIMYTIIPAWGRSVHGNITRTWSFTLIMHEPSHDGWQTFLWIWELAMQWQLLLHWHIC